MLTYATTPKFTMGRKGKELSPEEKELLKWKFYNWSRLLKRFHSTMSSFIRRYLLLSYVKDDNEKL